VIRRPAAALAAVGLVLAAAGCGGSTKDDTTTTAAAGDGGQTTTAEATTASGTDTTTGGGGGCSTTKPASAGQSKSGFSKPDQVLKPGQKADVVMTTSCGVIRIHLDQKLGGPIANSIAFLARKHFFDGLTFHRVVPNFVLQGGDPNGDGTGGPGYTVTKAPPTTYQYKLGDVAMAKRGDEPSGASGSQFFVISGPDGESLPPDYGIAGHATDKASKATIARINALGVGDGPPSQPVYIVSARLVLK
jgi:peptidyl-prolyl cis-trans isomerase B (cyclophilin B)